MSNEKPSERNFTSRDFTRAIFSPVSLALLLVAGAGAVLGGVLFGFLLKNLASGPASPPGTPSAPIIARGGALTFRNPTGQPFVASNGGYCAALPASTSTPNVTASLYQNPNNPHSPGNKWNKSPTTQNYAQTLVPNQTQLDFFGHPPGWTSSGIYPNQSNNGVRVTLLSNCGGSGSPGLFFLPEPAISPAKASGSAFYQDRAANVPDDDGSYFIRFQDTSCAKTTPSSTGDEDNCEHLSAVYVNASPTQSGSDPRTTATPPTWLCSDGECDIVFQLGNPNQNSNRNPAAPILPAKQ